ncbi:MAG: COG1361 S-layer family protein [Nitrososphaerales archaeon]
MKISSVILAVILFGSVITPTMVFAHYPHIEDECAQTEELGSREKCLLDKRESGKEVKFVDIFFSEHLNNVGGNADNTIPTKMEVEPGDGTTILVAVLANSGPYELTGLKGWLSLPVGFEAAGRAAGEPAFDSYDLGIPPGAVFVFEFPVDVKENTRVGMYKAILHIEYYKARDIGQNFRNFEVEFLLPGKSVLDARPVNSVLLPSSNNNPLIEIVNDGSAAASGLIASVGPSGEAAAVIETESQASQVNQLVNIGKKVFNVGVIEPHSKVVIDPILYVNPALGDTRQVLVVDIRYFDAYGQVRTVGLPVNFLVAGTATESIDFNVTTDKHVIHTITNTSFTVTLHNTGVETARSVEVTVNTPLTATVALEQQVPEASQSPISIIGGDGYMRISEIKPDQSADVEVTLFASEEAVNTAFQLPVTISYLDTSGGMKHIQRQVSVYVQGTIGLRVYDLGTTYIGNEPNLSGYILNEGTNLALFTTVELLDGQDSIKPAAGSQYLGDLTANSPLPFNIPIRFKPGISAGNYPVTLMISFKDDLRVPFEVKIDGEISYEPIVEVKRDSYPSYAMIATAAVIAGVLGIGVYSLRKKKIKLPIWAKKKKDDSSKDDDDIDFLSENKQ